MLLAPIFNLQGVAICRVGVVITPHTALQGILKTEVPKQPLKHGLLDLATDLLF